MITFLKKIKQKSGLFNKNTPPYTYNNLTINKINTKQISPTKYT